MSDMTHCDGPDCDKTKPRYGARRLRDGPWISLSSRPDDVDFCGKACAIAWLTKEAEADEAWKKKMFPKPVRTTAP